jgi:hypothetical protein
LIVKDFKLAALIVRYLNVSAIDFKVT